MFYNKRELKKGLYLKRVTSAKNHCIRGVVVRKEKQKI